MNDKKEAMRNFYLFILFLLTIVTVFTIKFSLSKKQENQALRLQIIMLNKEKKRAKPWARILPSLAQNANEALKTQNIITDQVEQIDAALLNKNFQKREEKSSNLSTEELTTLLNNQMGAIKKLTLSQLKKTKEIADELIVRTPDSYYPYKAKLIALLTEEGKFHSPVEELEVKQLLEEMAKFELPIEVPSQKEEALFVSSNQEINSLSEQLDQLTASREAIEREMDLIDESDSEFKRLEVQSADLAIRESDSLQRLSNLQESINEGLAYEEKFINEDIVHIPFMRMMAQNDYESVLTSADSFIQEFPSSKIGYFYLFKALEFLGRNDEALERLSNSKLTSEAQTQLIEKIKQSRGEDPKRYWEKLNF